MQKILACVAAALFSFYDLFELSLFNRLNPAIQTQFHLTPESIGMLSSCFLWANALGLIPVGLLLDRGHLRKTVGLLLSLSVAGNAVFLFSHTLWLAMVARSFQGFASAASLLVCMRLAIRWYKEKANAAIGWMIAIALSGGIFANFTDTWLTPIWMGSIILIILLLFLRDTKQEHIPQHFKFLSKPKNFLLGGYLGLINFPVFILGSLWGNHILTTTYHFTLKQSAFISSLIFAGIIVGSPIWGLVANKVISYKNIMLVGCGGLILVCLMLIIAPVNITVISFLFFSLGFFCCTQNMTYFALSKINSPETLSSATAITSVIFNSIGAVSQIVFYSAPWLFIFPLLGLGLLFISL